MRCLVIAMAWWLTVLPAGPAGGPWTEAECEAVKRDWKELAARRGEKPPRLLCVEWDGPQPPAYERVQPKAPK